LALTLKTALQQAVETNIRAGGDNAGRAIVIGTILGAYYGINEDNGIPIEWLLRVEDGLALWRSCGEFERFI
jgi:ADP-ribosylglycohydrolase.